MANNITTKSVGRFAAWFAVLAMVEGCAEAPRTSDDWETDQVMGESKDARRDDVSSAEAAGTEEREVGPGDDDSIEDEPGHQPRSGGEEDEEPERIADSGPAAARGAPDGPTAVTAPDGLDAGTDASSANTSPEHDACDSNPCHDGCSVDAGQDDCACPDGYTGQHCELKVCGSITVRSRADVEENGDCDKVQGDLTISSLGLTAIGADDFPFLTEITGDLMILGLGAQAPAPPHLGSVTLARLRAVNGAIVVLGEGAADSATNGPLSEFHLPALERIGARGSLGLLVHQSNLGVLDLPALETIEGGVALDGLLDLCTAELDSIERIGGNLVIRDVPRLSARNFESLRAAVAGTTSESMLGCCASSSDDRVSCESFSESARALHCTGC